jgi:phosphatidylethanolamine/phosphatidyl-N-methylethanolamine N-methyltransferase
MKTLDLDQNAVETVYARWAPIYDAVCGPVMVKGHRAAAAARAVGGKILEVGVGTGLSFDDYDNTTEITFPRRCWRRRARGSRADAIPISGMCI